MNANKKKTMKQPSVEKLEAAMTEWNARYPVGTPVIWYRLVNPLREGNITTTERFWDCECDPAYIHSEGDGECSAYAKERETQPDSRLREIMLMLMKEAGL